MALNLTVRKIFIISLYLCGAFQVWNSEARAAQLQLSWVDNASNEDGFKIQRKTGTTGTYAQIASVGANVSSYSDSTVVAGTTYCYEVLAFNSAGDSPRSPEACGAAAIATFTLTVTKAGVGSGTVTATGINCGADCTQVLPTGNVQLAAAASAGSTFSGWSGGGCSGTGATCTVNLTANTTVNATFVPQAAQTFTLTVAKPGTGSGTVTATGINCGADCTQVLPTGNVQLAAAASAGSTFSGWSGGGCSGTGATCTVNLTANTTVNATFVPQAAQTFTLTVAKPGTGSGTVTATGINCGADCTQVLPTGNVQLAAAASAGSTFSGWSGGGCSGTGATCTVNLTANTTVNATFVPQAAQTFTLTVAKPGTGSGTVTATGINCGADCTQVLPTGNVQLAAAASAGSTFSGWSGGGCSGTGATCTVNLTANTTVNATFQLQNNTDQLAARIGIFRPSTGEWFLDSNGNGKWDDAADAHLTSFPHNGGDLPVVGNWNADGTSSVGTFNPATGTWRLDTNGNDQWDGCEVDTCVISYGKTGDFPVIRNINGIGNIVGTFTPVSVTTTNRRRSVKRGVWNFDLNGNSTMDGCSVDECDTFGSGFERPIIGDWNGNGSENIGLFLNGYWYLDINGNERWDGSRGDRRFSFGRRGDLPVVGDWDGTGKVRLGVFRPSTAQWFLDKNGNGKWDDCMTDICLGPFGQQGDVPVVGKW